ncbi:MAG: hypothetical protein HY549_00790 [Elusimicrobia bacterium]|nr:hypothetical protein [Elusimicrobiota bacterium]
MKKSIFLLAGLLLTGSASAAKRPIRMDPKPSLGELERYADRPMDRVVGRERPHCDTDYVLGRLFEARLIIESKTERGEAVLSYREARLYLRNAQWFEQAHKRGKELISGLMPAIFRSGSGHELFGMDETERRVQKVIVKLQARADQLKDALIKQGWGRKQGYDFEPSAEYKADYVCQPQHALASCP